MSPEAIVLAAAVVGAGLYLVRITGKAIRFLLDLSRRVEAIYDLTSKELEHNHGSSMKDDLHGMAVALGLTQRQVDELHRRINRLTDAAKLLHPDQAWRFKQ